MPRETEIPRSVLADQVKDRLLQAILAGRYAPGSRIVETRVAKEYGVSQAPVREALRGLEAIGVVEITAFRGARVRRPSAHQLLEAYAIRTQLETLGARLALPLITEEDLADLAGSMESMRLAARMGDTFAEATADAAFHGRIISIASNATLERVWRHLEPFSRTYITLVVPGVDRDRVAGLHAPILEALRRRDPHLAGEALRRHFDDAGSMLGDLWAKADPAAAADEGVDTPGPTELTDKVREPAHAGSA